MRAEYYERLKNEKGREPPKEFLNPPQLPPWLTMYADAFWRLNNDRPIGPMGGMGPIPFLVIDAYARRYGIDDTDSFDRFRLLIQHQDGEYLRIKSMRGTGGKDGFQVSTDDATGIKALLARVSESRQSTETEGSD